MRYLYNWWYVACEGGGSWLYSDTEASSQVFEALVIDVKFLHSLAVRVEVLFYFIPFSLSVFQTYLCLNFLTEFVSPENDTEFLRSSTP